MVDTGSKPDSRTERSKQVILDATRELLAEEGGVRALTVEAVAARSGVAKTTIYRHWRDKQELALDAVMIDVISRFDEPADIGDTRKELLTFINSVVKVLASDLYGSAMQGLASEIATDPELAHVYRERVVEPRIRQVRNVIQRGIERGELRAGTDSRLVHELLVGPIFYRLLFSGAPVDRRHAARLVDAVLDAFRAQTSRKSGKTIAAILNGVRAIRSVN
jgi:AcrR family transcriptional regulator